MTGISMKKTLFASSVGFFILAVFVCFIPWKQFAKRPLVKETTVDTVFLGPKGHQAAFEQSAASGRDFYDLNGKAGDSIKAGDYQNAIKLLNESLPHVGIGIEKGMVYKKLAEIYRDLGDMENELKYLELLPKYVMNQDVKNRVAMRVEEIRSILANAETSNGTERYAAPPVYGRPFQSYREVVVAQAGSEKHYEKAAGLLRYKKYAEAIEEYKKAYYPESAHNAFIESGLIECYRGLNMHKEVLILIDYTLKNRNWGPENVKQFQSLREQLTKN